MILFLLFACSTQQSTQTTPVPTNATQKANIASQTQEIDIAQFYEKHQKGVLTIIDVRTPEEFAAGHIPNAQNIPLDTLSQRLGELNSYRESDIFLVCESGRRSQKATDLLTQKGFSHAINVVGGTSGWRAKGYPTQQ